MNIVNLAIQVLPMHQSSRAEAYRIVDTAIATIQRSGLKYMVCPFETVIEGPYDQVMQLITDIKDDCHKAGAGALLINMKLHTHPEEDMLISDKMAAYTR